MTTSSNTNQRLGQKSTKSSAKAKSQNVTPPALDQVDRVEMIRITAYYLAQKRDFEPGHELEDWVQAETLVNSDSTNTI